MAEQLKIYASLTMLLLFSTWFVFTIDPEDIKKVPVSIDSPDYYMNTFITTSFSETGTIEKKLSARRLAHYPYDDRSEFTSVYISTTNPDNTIWELTAEKGKAFSSTNAIHLQGDINISEASKSSSLNVQTETLDIDYKKNIAKTADRVLITDTYGTVSAEGMYLDFGNHELT
ncbi:MAG: LPS export ABC transporter periplasmic protein LptC, partial [Thiohalomonadales bacterium]